MGKPPLHLNGRGLIGMWREALSFIDTGDIAVKALQR